MIATTIVLRRKLAGAKVNIKSIYATTTGAGTATVVVTVSNVDKAQSAIGLSDGVRPKATGDRRAVSLKERPSFL